jgi:hypothetical protein
MLAQMEKRKIKFSFAKEGASMFPIGLRMVDEGLVE